MNHWKWYLAAAVTVTICCFSVVRAANGDSSGPAAPTTQNFAPARFALLAGTVNVAKVLSNDGNNHQQVMVKMDTRTGDCWVLQLAVNSGSDPTVQSAVWAPVTANGNFQPHGNGNN